ncbi:hypothetical protein QBC36DRAFT_315417 [Triangularia setosa]|uniref:DUF7600 domain-containing protein n=1 Tax=Triangularia setosa TaxID=2587417 RepID=A0AAN6VXY1_9PEZI|nr:hypothetical protein QBC36DRAFT_315417 [Podospora setosa]
MAKDAPTSAHPVEAHDVPSSFTFEGPFPVEAKLIVGGALDGKYHDGFTPPDPGCKELHKICFHAPEAVSRVTVFTIVVGPFTRHIASLLFLTTAGENFTVGYHAPAGHSGTKEQFLDLDSPMTGFNIALGWGGIHALQCVTSSGGLSSSTWIGCPHDTTKTRRLSSCLQVKRFLDAGFDASQTTSKTKKTFTNFVVVPQGMRLASVIAPDEP